MNKRTIILTILILIFSSNTLAKSTDNVNIKVTDQIIKEQLDTLNISELELVLEDILRGNEVILPKIDMKENIISMIKGEKKFDLNEIINGIVKTIFNEINNNLNLIVQILIITIACSLLTNLQSAFEKDTVSQLAQYTCYILLVMQIMNSFNLALELGKNTVINMVNFMQILLPILLTLLTAIGSLSTRTIFHPVLVAIVNVIGILIKNLVFPLIFFTFIISVISNISQKVQFSKLSQLMRQIIIVLISASFTVFIGIITMYGLGANIDGVTIRTAKFAVDNFIPIIGKFLSDAMEVVVGSSLILKNGIGIIGLASLFLICIIPALKIIIIIFIYKIAAAFVEPISSINISNFYTEVANSLLLILIGMLSVAVMFFITITVIVEAGNATMMLR
ncbi:stage III sporulation protein AE [Tepidimicrobium xylanilyticum]|uniref:Stage III sporulation protein AE n=1 Tax=Tepidimicrobium xylanilyticum TaxID=1123352 RepID=A0A1H3CSE1_9FIRM|nr:stage III sporulation protein AE [Tepidimicrobium xylanilyticum]GMG97712.1 stage III sporulation protein AE [Tepidimicrobium xylanilyticum]SDX56464.1 stage III sporulation protein AE [Tepidimicrobium xylanilyticum]